ncbi:Uncharacterised protein [Salmonella enterica subsp. enterica serovar Typhi]|nr:Uncharacterised protein [Salmonella enterica subsp. enterica serovar Typhi]
MPDVQTHAARQRSCHRGAQLAVRPKNTVRLTVVTVGNDIARRQTLRYFVQIRRVIANMYHQRQVAVFLLHGFSAFQRRDAVNAYHAAAHPRLEADDKIRMAFYRLPNRISVNIGHVSQLVLGNKPNA